MRRSASGAMCSSDEVRRARPSAGRRVALAVAAAVAAVAGAAARPAAAQEAGDARLRVEASPREVAPEADLPVAEGAIQLALDEAIAIALQRNLALAVERYNQEEAEFALLQNRGIYDLNLGADLATSEETSPSASQLVGAEVEEQESGRWNFGLSRLLPTGGTANLDWTNRRFETNSLFATVNPSYRVDLDLNLVQPLLRNLGRQTTERNLLIARNNLGISRESFELQVATTIEDVGDAYWTLVEAREQLGVAEESLALARELHEMNRIRVDVGTLAPLELVQSEVGIATREEEIIRARAAVDDAADRLRRLLNLGSERAWALPIVPVTEPEMAPIEIRVEDAIATALAERPELRSQGFTIENLAVDTSFFRNQERPRLDLSVLYGFNGLGGDVTERDFLTGEILSQTQGGYDDALDQITGGDFEGWTVALTFAYPLQNRTARAQTAIAEVALERGRTELQDLELQVITEVRTAARQVDTARQQIESARVSRRLAERNLDAERKRYENGMSTSFQVLEIQEDLTEARSREVSAVTGYRIALVRYYRAIGRLLEETGVEVVEGGAAEEA